MSLHRSQCDSEDYVVDDPPLSQTSRNQDSPPTTRSQRPCSPQSQPKHNSDVNSQNHSTSSSSSSHSPTSTVNTHSQAQQRSPRPTISSTNTFTRINTPYNNLNQIQDNPPPQIPRQYSNSIIGPLGLSRSQVNEIYDDDDDDDDGELDDTFIDENHPLNSHEDDRSFFRAYRDLDRPVQLSRPAFLFLIFSALMALCLSVLAISGLSLELDQDILHLFYGPGFQVGYQEYAIQFNSSMIDKAITLPVNLPRVSINSYEFIFLSAHYPHYAPFLPANETSIPQFYLDLMSNYDDLGVIFANEEYLQAFRAHSKQSDLAFKLQSMAINIVHRGTPTTDFNVQSVQRQKGSANSPLFTTANNIRRPSDQKGQKSRSAQKIHNLSNLQGDVDALNLDDVLTHLYNIYVSSYNYHTSLTGSQSTDSFQPQTQPKVATLRQILADKSVSFTSQINTAVLGQILKEERFSTHSQILNSIHSLNYIPITSFQSLLYKVNPNLVAADQLKQQQQRQHSNPPVSPSLLSTLFTSLTTRLKTQQHTPSPQPETSTGTTRNAQSDSDLSAPIKSFGHSVMVGWDGLPQVSALLEPSNICLIKCDDLTCSGGKTLLFSLTASITDHDNPATSSLSTTTTSSPIPTTDIKTAPKMQSLNQFSPTSPPNSQTRDNINQISDTLVRLSLRQTMDLSEFFTNVFDVMNSPLPASAPQPIKSDLETQEHTPLQFDEEQQRRHQNPQNFTTEPYSSFSTLSEQNQYLYNAIQELPHSIRTLALVNPLTRIQTSPTQDTVITITDVSGSIYVIVCPDEFCFPPLDKTVSTSTLRRSLSAIRIASTALFSTMDVAQSPIGNQVVAYIDGIDNVPRIVSCLSVACDVNQVISFPWVKAFLPAKIRVGFTGDGNLFLSAAGTCIVTPMLESSFISRYTTPSDSSNLFKAMVKNNIIEKSSGYFLTEPKLRIVYKINNPNYVDPADPSSGPPGTQPISDRLDDVNFDLTQFDYEAIFRDAGFDFILEIISVSSSQLLAQQKYVEIFNILYNMQNCMNDTIVLDKENISTSLISRKNVLFIRCIRLDCLPGYVLISTPLVFNPTAVTLESQGHSGSVHSSEKNSPLSSLTGPHSLPRQRPNQVRQVTPTATSLTSSFQGVVNGTCIDVSAGAGSDGYPLIVILYQPNQPMGTSGTLNLASFTCATHDCRSFVLENADDGDNYNTYAQLNYVQTGIGTASNLFVHSSGLQSLTNRIQIRNSPYGAASTLIQFEHQGFALLAECSNVFCESVSVNALFMQFSQNNNLTLPYTPPDSLISQSYFTSGIDNVGTGAKLFHKKNPQVNISRSRASSASLASYFPPLSIRSQAPQQSPLIHISATSGLDLTEARRNANRGVCTIAPCGDIRISSVDGMPLIVFGTEYPYIVHCSNMICLPYIID